MNTNEKLIDSEVWTQADKFFKKWLKNVGYYLTETRIYDDCIGYRCNRNGYTYAIYMFAYGQNQTTQLDGDYCKKLLNYSLSEDSMPLIVCLKVNCQDDGKNIRYQVCGYRGEKNPLEFWCISKVEAEWILEYYPSKEIVDAKYKLMYAFNRDDMDVYDCIIAEDAPSFKGIDSQGTFMNSAFYGSLLKLHREYGDMNLGYVRYNDIVFSSVPYIDGYGFFGFTVNSANKIQELRAYRFDEKKPEVVEFIKTEEHENDDLYENVPSIASVDVLPPVDMERFALKVEFDDGQCRKYVLPIDRKSEHDEVISYKSHVFTDKIWGTAKIVKNEDKHRGTIIKFCNDFFVTALKCYEEGEIYSEPVLCNDVLYEDNNIIIKRIWNWNACSAYEDEGVGILRTLISRDSLGCRGYYSFTSCQGKRLSSINFDYVDDFHEGVARVMKAGYGYGFIDESMKLAIPMVYDYADNFYEGKAKVKRGEDWIYINKEGKETPIPSKGQYSKYQDVGQYCEDMCKVSILKLGFDDLAYYSDHIEIAGTWGFVDKNGVEIITPQYIYAEDFSGGIALVCKGKWTLDKKWDDEYNSGKYWTDEELWGAIDKEGNATIPFIFDDIVRFWDADDVFMAHFGGWADGHWGVIDNHGNWLVDPIFEDIDYGYKDGLFAFYSEYKWNDGALLGIYDLKQKKVIFEPQFLDVDFMDDGRIFVEVYDEKLRRTVEKLIDQDGEEKFKSPYSLITPTIKGLYEVLIRDNDGDRRGLIDENGTVVLPCESDVIMSGIYPEQRIVIYKSGEKCGIRDFDGNVLVQPIYFEIHGICNPLITVRVGENGNYKEGLVTMDGTTIIPAEFKEISWCGNNYILCRRESSCEMFHYIKKENNISRNSNALKSLIFRTFRKKLKS